MQAKIFFGGGEKVEGKLNEWMESVRPRIQKMSTAVAAKNLVSVVILYEEALPEPLRVRGEEKPGESPRCKKCGSEMVVRHRKVDGNPFWGCSTFPACKSIISFDEDDKKATDNGRLEHGKSGFSYSNPDFEPGGDDMGGSGPLVGGGIYSDDSDDIPF